MNNVITVNITTLYIVKMVMLYVFDHNKKDDAYNIMLTMMPE